MESKDEARSSPPEVPAAAPAAPAAAGDALPQQKRFTSLMITAWQFPAPDFDLKKMTYYEGQSELCPKTGKKHLQLYVCFRGQKSMRQVKNLFGKSAHLSLPYSTPAACSAYVSKKESAIAGTHFKFGVLPEHHPGQRNDLVAMCAAFRKDGFKGVSDAQIVRFGRGLSQLSVIRASESPGHAKRHVYWFYGDTGTGKSHAAFALAETFGRYFVAPPKGGWFCGYDGQGTIVVNEYDAWYLPSELLLYTDKWPVALPAKHGSRMSSAVRWIFTSSLCPYEYVPPNRAHELIRRITECRHYTEKYIEGRETQYYSPDLLANFNGLQKNSA